MRRLVFVLLLLPAPLAAQARTVVSGYLAADNGMVESPVLLGLTAARETGWFAGRLSMGFDMTEPTAPVGDALAPPPTDRGIWNADADALLYLGGANARRTIIPYALAGVGLRGYETDGRIGAAPNYSYGGGFRAPLGGGFAMEGEARWREVMAPGTDTRTPLANSGMEFRFGFSVGFGGARAASVLPNLPASMPGRALPASAPPARVASATLNTAEQYIGVPYLWGGNTPQEGFDCSGFIRYVFNLNGIHVPRVSRDQARYGDPVPLDVRSFQPGDILAFASSGTTVDHAAIYAGNGRIIHSSSSGKGVRYDDLFSQRGKWYLDHMVAARRIIGVTAFTD